MKRKFAFLLLVAAIASFLSLGAPAAPSTPVKAATTSSQTAKYDFAASSSTLGNQLLLELRKKNKDENVVVSPVSIHLALTMLANGADKSTLDEICKILGSDAQGLQVMNDAAEDFLVGSVSADPKLEISFANALFSQKGNSLAPQYLKVLQRHLQARAKELDFQAQLQSAVDSINQWVDRQTNGKIPKLFDTLDPNTKLVIISALYLKASWRKPFKKSDTQERQFFITDKVSKKVPTMLEHGRLPYLETQTFQAVSLQYTDARYKMYVYLPKSGTSLDDLILAFTPSVVAANCAKFSLQEGRFYLPRVDVSYSQSLKSHLRSLGMNLAFDPSANLSKLFAPSSGRQIQLVADDVVHKTKLVVDESGTEAAAVTAIISVGAGVGGKDDFTMDVNRPYLMLIRDEDTGAILFMATIVDPTK